MRASKGRDFTAVPPPPPPMKSIQPIKGQHMGKHIYAYTALGACCPEYVSIQGNAQGGVAITVRSDSDMRVSTMRLSDDELLKLIQASMQHLTIVHREQLIRWHAHTFDQGGVITAPPA